MKSFQIEYLYGSDEYDVYIVDAESKEKAIEIFDGYKDKISPVYVEVIGVEEIDMDVLKSIMDESCDILNDPPF